MAQVTKVSEFSLKWNNHHNALVSVLDSLLEREELVDVTLAAEGQFVNAHRFVLYACSQYFEDLLSQQPGKSAVIFLKDVRFSDLKALVEYMYKGVVNVSEEQLTPFLETAKALKIKGLADDSQQEPARRVEDVQVIQNQSAQIVEAPEMHLEVQIENSEMEAVEPEPMNDNHSDSASVTPSPEGTAKRKRGRPKGKSFPKPKVVGGPLLVSKKQNKGLLPFVCEYCGHSYRKESALSFHQRKECGKEPNFTCSADGCPYRSKRKADIKRHWKTIHEPDEIIDSAAST